MMRSIEWGFLFVLSGIGIALANFVGFQVGIAESLPGICVVIVLSLLGMACTKLIPLKLPIVAYVSVPRSRRFRTQSTSRIPAVLDMV